MLNSTYLLIPFLLQVLWISVDEFYCHHQRKLPRWERIGHSFDTITVIACICWILFVPPTPNTVLAYAGLGIFSCLFILKDENVHHRECGVVERWLHTLSFVIHPIVLMSAGLLWPSIHLGSARIFSLIQYQGFEKNFMAFEAILLGLFLLYQTVYWNFIWSPANKDYFSRRVKETNPHWELSKK